MLPFVLIYGVSAFLFNHAAGANEPRVLPVPNSLAIDADQLAANVANVVGVALAGEPRAELDGDYSFEFEHDGQRQRLTLPCDGSLPALRNLPRSSPRGDRVPTEVLAPTHDAAMQAALAVLAAADVPHGDLRRTAAPTLRFRADGDQFTLSMDRAQASRRPLAAVDASRLLMRLHTLHGYGSSAACVAWAVVVDLMAASMLLWAGSGMLMWWQRRSHRRPGAIVVLVALGFAIALGALLADSLFR